MTQGFRFLWMTMGLLALAACADLYPSTTRPDYAIRVAPTKDGNGVALPPACPSWNDHAVNPFDNQPYPQFGCATAKNLAGMAEKPNDLIEGRSLAPQRGVIAVGAVRRYDNNQTRGLIMPSADTSAVAVTTASTPGSNMTGDITAGGNPATSAAPGAP